MDKKLRCITYSRVSTSHHDQKPEIQVEELRRYCASRGWEITEELVDHGFSGGTAERPALKTLMKLARTRKVDIICVTKLDRLFRSLKHLILTLDEFETLGVKFVSVHDGLDYTSAASRFFIQVLGSLAELEKSILVERTKLGLEHARRNGKKLGRPKQRDDEAILELRTNGLTYTEIEERLKVSRGAIYRAVKTVSKTVK